MKYKEADILETFDELLKGEEYIIEVAQKKPSPPYLFDLPTYQELLDLVREAKRRVDKKKEQEEEDMKRL